jgi:hypothetical protein
MKVRLLFIALMVMACTLCVIPVSATWIDKGTATNTAADGNVDSNKMAVQQVTHYWYDDSNGNWKVDIEAYGDAERWDGTTKMWVPATGSFGVYAYADGEFIVGETFGTKTVWYTSPLKSKYDQTGYGLLYKRTDFFTPPKDKNSMLSIKIAGNIKNFAAISTTQATK